MGDVVDVKRDKATANDHPRPQFDCSSDLMLFMRIKNGVWSHVHDKPCLHLIFKNIYLCFYLKTQNES